MKFMKIMGGHFEGLADKKDEAQAEANVKAGGLADGSLMRESGGSNAGGAVSSATKPVNTLGLKVDASGQIVAGSIPKEDPRVQRALRNPKVQAALQAMQRDPESIEKLLQDKEVLEAIGLLQAADILQIQRPRFEEVVEDDGID